MKQMISTILEVILTPKDKIGEDGKEVESLR
jgi:hypothetical protein